MSNLALTWSHFKSFVNGRRVPVQWVDLESDYRLWAYDGPMSVYCTLQKDGGADVIEFEAEYKPTGNRSPTAKITQTLGEDGFAISPRGFSFEAPPAEVSTHYLQIDEALAVKGGILYPQNAVIGDWIEVGIEDKDNVIGYGAGVTLRDYVPMWYIMPNTQNRLEDVSIGLIPAPGLYLRVIYHSVAPIPNLGGVPVKVAMNLLSWRIVG